MSSESVHAPKVLPVDGYRQGDGDLRFDIRLLGPLTATVGGRSFVPTATKPRSVLALLLVNVNRVVPTASIQRELWGTQPPRSALTTVQTYVLQIRKLLGAAMGDDDVAKQVLVTTASGYLFRLVGAERDVDVFDRLAAEGARALRARRPADASEALAQALRLWRGDPLVDVTAGSNVEASVVGLQNSRTTVVEQRIEADLVQGYHRHVLGELASLTVEDPFNENLRTQYMVALHRCGRRREALTVFHDTRRLLIDELGLEPGPGLRAANEAILRGEDVAAASSPLLPVGGFMPAAAS